MNKPDPVGREAVVRYEDNDFTLLQEGHYVRCAVSGAQIRLDELRYWSVDHQEAYRGPEEALQRWRDLQARSDA